MSCVNLQQINRSIFFILLIIVLTMTLSCKTLQEQSEIAQFQSQSEIVETPQNVIPFAEERNKIITSAKNLMGIKYNTQGIEVNGKKFTIDCIGTIRAAFWGAGIDIAQDFYKYTGNGVALLYFSLKERDALKKDKVPAVGDVIFWDNTWDKNGDGVFGNDPLTHAGIVLEIDNDGTIKYLHASVSKGVTIGVMNLHTPSLWQNETGKIINSGMYLGSYYGNPQNPPQWTSGDLFRAFGDCTKIIEIYKNKI